MSSATNICAGCGQEFTSKGYVTHLRLTRDPRCTKLQDGLMYRYTTTPVDQPSSSPPASYPITPDVQMLDVAGEESVPQSDIFPSHSHEAIYMSLNEDSEDDDAGFEDGGGDIDQSLETVFHHPPHQSAASIDLDTVSETSDEEDESQQQPVPPLPNPENSGCSGLSSTQTGRYFHSMANYVRIIKWSADSRVFVKFGGRAGEALPVRPEHVGYVGYSHALGVEDATVSEWAPFSTRTEWELARWAKLRGPSSTALSELLKIDGVSQTSSSDPTN